MIIDDAPRALKDCKIHAMLMMVVRDHLPQCKIGLFKDGGQSFWVVWDTWNPSQCSNKAKLWGSPLQYFFPHFIGNRHFLQTKLCSLSCSFRLSCRVQDIEVQRNVAYIFLQCKFSHITGSSMSESGFQRSWTSQHLEPSQKSKICLGISFSPFPNHLSLLHHISKKSWQNIVLLTRNWSCLHVGT